jgi:O-6-methylguanine DNA methyltransferase
MVGKWFDGGMKIVEHAPREVLCGIGTTPLGEVAVGVTPEGELCRVSYTRGRELGDIVEEWLREWPGTKFGKKKPSKDWLKLPLLALGNDYQKRVWEEIMTVPKGQVETYGGIAARIGEPRTARAVGRACRMCCLAYVVPCQRIIAAGGIGGFFVGDGVAFKASLLAMEGWKGEPYRKKVPAKVHTYRKER